MQKARQRCMVCSSSNLVSGGHGDMALNQQKHAAPRQWHGKGSKGQVPTQHQHAAPLHRWTVDAGPKAIEEDLHHPGTVCPSPRGSGEGLEHHRLHEGSVHRKRRKSEQIFGAPTHPTAAQQPQDGRREHFSRCRRPSSKQGNTVLNP